MGEVYAAHDPQLDRRVAIKVLTATYRNAEAAARLVREAQALAKLQHPNVVSVHDAGEVDGRVFLAMSFVEGLTLGEHLVRNRPPWNETVALFVAAGRGLAAAHSAGLVHRDFKPGNVLVDGKGHVSVTDFGLARGAAELTQPAASTSLPAFTPNPDDLHRSHSSLDSNMTQAGVLIGTPAYMAPEQHAGERGSARSDQFSFCVALWEALFARHPFVPIGHDRVTSPFEFTHLISEGGLVQPGAGHAVPRRVLAALTRGLDRHPERRWPSMDLLLDELEPPPGSYRTAVVSLTAVATLGVGLAVWLAVRPGEAAGRTCGVEARERAATAWSPQRASEIEQRFAGSGRSYASSMAREAVAELDRYATRWSELATDGCKIGLGRDEAARALAVHRAACLDNRLTALRTMVGQLASDTRPEIVDNAVGIIGGLPDLDDCADARALEAAGSAPPDVADKLPALDARLAQVRMQIDAGLFRDALAPAEALVKDAMAVRWPPLQISAHRVLGEARLGLWLPALDGLLTSAAIATEAHLERDAARAYAISLIAAGSSRKREAVETLAPVARAMAAATGDPVLLARAHIAHGRALVRVGQYAAGESECRAGKALIEAQPSAARTDLAESRRCMIESLVPLGKRGEARAVLEATLADARDMGGPDHPVVADLETSLASFVRESGKLDEARAMVERGLALRERAFGANHIRVAESLAALADYERDAGKRKAMLERALAIAESSSAGGMRGHSLAAQIHRRFALAAGEVDDNAATRQHFEREKQLLTEFAGPDSTEMAVLLVNYGQYATRWDFDGGVAMLRRSAEILDAQRDPRAGIARGALALILSNADRWAEALPIMERVVAEADPDRIPPETIGQMRYNLARALVETRGDRTRAAELARTARADFERAGPDGEHLLTRLDAFEKKHKLK